MKYPSFPPLRLFVAASVLALASSISAEPLQISGVYPHLTMYNNENECGTGAVVPWQGHLYAITYAPHSPAGSSDKLHIISPDLEQIIYEGSVGGTPANRLIHEASNQLLIGPYLVDEESNIRVIPPTQMYGRLTGTAPHLTDPNKVYHATMEQGLYEVDVRTLEVTCLIRDRHSNAPEEGVITKVPGAHGKGLYSGQGRVIYSNNGEKGSSAQMQDPTITAGALAEWFGEGDWELVRRNQFTEISGPGGICGNPNPETDVIWAMGWDAKSLILALLEEGEWHYYRLPKGSHSYDGSHGWNTEWPRIREIGEEDLLATMHGTFWKFPAGFSRENSGGISPRSNYLKVIGDFCRWGDRIVLGCDDSAKSEFLNRRGFKAEHASPLQSNSNFWFVEPEQLDNLGPVIGRGSVWLREDLAAGQVSEPYLFSGYDQRQFHLTHDSETDVTFTLEVDRDGTGQWSMLREVTLPAGDSVSEVFSGDEAGAWIRLISQQSAQGVTALFQYRNHDTRTGDHGDLFAGIADQSGEAASHGLMRSLSYDRLGLAVASNPEGDELSYYELNQKMELIPMDESQAAEQLVAAVQQPRGSVTVDEASVLIVEDGQRYRLPKNPDFHAEALQESELSGKSLSDYLDSSLTIGAGVNASSVHAEYVASMAIDGGLGDESRWIGRNGGDAWLEVDLGEEKTIRSFWVVSGWKQEAPYVASEFEVQIKASGEWQTVTNGRISGNVFTEREIVLPEAIRAQHLRLITGKEGFFRIYEFAAFGEVLDVDRHDASGYGIPRICREVATERDLLNVHGTFYELPARNAQGVAKIRPIASHELAVHDFCSHNGLLLFTGVDAETESDHIFRSADGKAAVWAGVVDDLWQLGKPRGLGGPWKDTAVKAGEPSDPYLMTGYDEKTVQLTSSEASTLTLEVDIDGTGLWIPWKSFSVDVGETISDSFPGGFSAYWVRAISNTDSTATVQLEYR